MTQNDAYNNLHRCDCSDHAEHCAHDWHESRCAYRKWYVEQQQQRQDDVAKRAKAIGAWR